MKTIQLEVVTPEELVYSEDVESIVAKGADGELGVLPGHIPLVTPLQTGALKIKKNNQEQFITISGGYLEVRPDKVTVLADTAELT